jgi:hypothetical protein
MLDMLDAEEFSEPGVPILRMLWDADHWANWCAQQQLSWRAA